MRRLFRVSLVWALTGVCVAVIIALLDIVSKHSARMSGARGLVPERMILIAWPSSIMMLATEDASNWHAGVALTVSILANAVIYAFCGMVCYFIFLGVRAAFKAAIQ